MQKSETVSKETEKLAKAVAVELDKADPQNADDILEKHTQGSVDENTRRVHGSGSCCNNPGACETPKS